MLRYICESLITISTLRVSRSFSAMTPRQKDTPKRNTILKSLVSNLCVLNFRLQFRLHFSFSANGICKQAFDFHASESMILPPITLTT